MEWREFGLMVAAAFCSAALIIVLLPAFRRYALARPNARSSHSAPTPQGGGVAVVLAVMFALGIDGAFVGAEGMAPAGALPLVAAVVLLTVLGAIDDMFPIAPLWRLAVQAIAVILAVSAMPAELRAIPILPV